MYDLLAMNFEIKRFIVSGMSTNNYIVGEPDSGRALMVDMGEYTPDIKAHIEKSGIQLELLLLTHDHWDHSDGIKDLLKDHSMPVVKKDSDWGTTQGDRFVKHGEEFDFCGTTVRVLETHGHTPDGISFWFGDFVFCGDALFAGAVGGTAARSDHVTELGTVRSSLFTLPDDTIVYPGHGPPTTIGAERNFNPFFF